MTKGGEVAEHTQLKKVEETLEERFARVDRQLGRQDETMALMIQLMNRVEAKLDAMPAELMRYVDVRLEDMERKTSVFGDGIQSHRERLDDLEDRVSYLEDAG